MIWWIIKTARTTIFKKKKMNLAQTNVDIWFVCWVYLRSEIHRVVWVNCICEPECNALYKCIYSTRSIYIIALWQTHNYETFFILLPSLPHRIRSNKMNAYNRVSTALRSRSWPDQRRSPDATQRSRRFVNLPDDWSIERWQRVAIMKRDREREWILVSSLAAIT